MKRTAADVAMTTTAVKRARTAGYRRTRYIPYATKFGEWKYSDTQVNQDLNTTAGYILLNGLVPGTAATQRIGQNVSIKSIEVKLRMQVTPATGVDQFVRVIIALDRQPNAAAPVIGDLLIGTSVTAPRNLNNRKRFKILMDKPYAMGGILNGAGTGSQTPNLRMLKKYIKFKRPIVTEYNTGNAGTVADIASNSLYLFTLGTEVAGNTDTNMLGYIRIRYTDM